MKRCRTPYSKRMRKCDLCDSRSANCFMFSAETPGVSQCYDAQGKSVGKVVADKSGNTVIYNDKDVPIGTGQVKQTGPRSYEVNVIPKICIICKDS